MEGAEEKKSNVSVGSIILTLSNTCPMYHHPYVIYLRSEYGRKDIGTIRVLG